MLNLEDHFTGVLYPNMTNAERVAASTDTGDLHWVGPEVVAAGADLTAGRDAVTGHVQMYAPNPQEPGSSVSHFDTALFPNEQSEPFYTGVDHSPGLAIALMADIGWVTSPEPQTEPEIVSPEPGSTLSATTETFSWVSNGAQVEKYRLWIATASARARWTEARAPFESARARR